MPTVVIFSWSCDQAKTFSDTMAMQGKCMWPSSLVVGIKITARIYVSSRAMTHVSNACTQQRLSKESSEEEAGCGKRQRADALLFILQCN